VSIFVSFFCLCASRMSCPVRHDKAQRRPPSWADSRRGTAKAADCTHSAAGSRADQPQQNARRSCVPQDVKKAGEPAVLIDPVGPLRASRSSRLPRRECPPARQDRRREGVTTGPTWSRGRRVDLQAVHAGGRRKGVGCGVFSGCGLEVMGGGFFFSFFFLNFFFFLLFFFSLQSEGGLQRTGLARNRVHAPRETGQWHERRLAVERTGPSSTKKGRAHAS